MEPLNKGLKALVPNGGVEGSGCKAPNDEPRPPTKGTSKCTLEENSKEDPSRVRQAQHPSQTPDGTR